MSAEFNPNNLFAASSAQSPPAADSDDLMWELLSLYMDGEASPAEAAQVEQMLRHDAEYARAYAFMQQTSSVVHSIVEVEPPAFLRDAILAKTSHRLTFGKRLSAGIATLRTQLALPPMGRLALAGGSMAACALLIGIYTAQPASNGIAPSNVTMEKPSPVQDVANSSAGPASVNTPEKNRTTPAKAVVQVQPVQKKSLTINFKGLQQEPPIAPLMLTAADKPQNAKIVPVNIQVPNFKFKRDDGKIAGIKPSHALVPPSSGTDSPKHDTNTDTQNVSPMMDASVQHRQAPPMTQVAMRPDDDLDRDVVTSNSDSGAPAVPIASTDTDSGTKGRLVGKLQLSKLPPTARHIQTAADIQRIQESRNLAYTATVMDGMQRRDSDLPVLSGKF